MSKTNTTADDLPTDPEEHVEEIEEEIILNADDLISEPRSSEDSTVPFDILQMTYSFTYDCKKYFNLVAPDPHTVVFVGGNIIHFFNIKTKEMKFRRSYLGGGIGHITVNPNSDYRHLTIAENGDDPPIIIYEWPSMELVGLLRGGAAKRFAHINYSPDGELLVSQSYGPDFLITVWKWSNKRSPIVLRTKAHVHDVYTCMFSPYVPGQITTAGSGHIKFWKMAQTFTGLKLQGELGRFGKTEISDVVGIFPMPDEKVISGSEWGNLLVWEAGLIKIEVFRSLRRTCHKGPVMQLLYIREQGEIWSISIDGWLRAWEYRMIDEADPPDDDRIVQMVPSYEREIPGVKFMSVFKKNLYNPEDTLYFAQDGGGGIWQIDLVLRTDYEPPERLMLCHAGKVMDMSTCPWGPYLASVGEAGILLLFNYETRKLVFHHKFNANGRALLWLPIKLHFYYLIGGFDDGVIRVFTININQNYEFTLRQSIKPHNKPVTRITLNSDNSVLVTGGEDSTIFIFKINKLNQEITLIPIGFVPITGIPTCFTWYPEKETILLVGCHNGKFFEFDVPKQPLSYTTISYHLYTLKPVKQQFTTCKSQIRRDIYLKEVEKKKADKVARKLKEIAKLKADNPGLEVDEETYLADSEEEVELEPLYIPEVPNPIYFMIYTNEDTIWLSMGGYDAGYIYEYHMDQKQQEPIKATIIFDGDDIEMHEYIYSPERDYIITSTQYGEVRVNKINPEDFRDFSDYWIISMHDNFNGRITKFQFSYDNTNLFSCGEDGNIFSYHYKTEINYNKKPPKLTILPEFTNVIVDENYQSLSLEEKMIKAEEEKQLRLANEHKRKLRQRLKELTAKMTSLLDRNCKLPVSQRYTLRQLVVDERIMKALDDRLEAKVALEKRKLAYDVEKSTVAMKKLKRFYTDCLDMYPFTVTAFNTDSKVMTILQRGLGSKFYTMYENIKVRLEEEALKGRIPPREAVVAENKGEKIKPSPPLEPFLVGLSPSTIEFRLGSKITRLLKKYRERRQRKEQRQEEWNAMYAKKPLEGVNHPDDEKQIKVAEETIGDFKLKSAENYKITPELRETTVVKYHQLLEARLTACKIIVHNFNAKVYKMRNRKQEIIDEIKKLTKKLRKIHEELPECRILEPPTVPDMTDEDFPERKLHPKLDVESDFKAYLNRDKVKETSKDEEEEDIDADKLFLGIETLPNIPGNSREIIMHFIRQYPEPFDPFKSSPDEWKDGKDNPWEKEVKIRRLISKIQEQDTIIEKIKTMIEEFDKDVEELARKRFFTIMNSAFLDLHILVLNQELIIVKKFETFENELSKIALQKWTEMMDMGDSMKRIEIVIDGHNSQIEACNEQIKVIQQTFVTAAKDNKFWDFLRRIFKKKYRPPKVLNPDESESSSFSSESSSESEEDDAGSLDSQNIGPIRLDESICPKGCDRELYDYTFQLRSQRHELERKIKDEQKSIETRKKELEQSAKKMRLCEQANKKAQSDLEEYQREKQRKLNEVSCLVTLKLSQLQHVNPDGCSVAKLSDTLVFDSTALTNLQNRVGELQKETLEERLKHKRNKIHLRRMTVDCRFMQKTISDLKKEINEKMLTKFGSKVKIDEIEESILKRLILTLRMRMLHLEKLYEEDINNARILYGEKQVELKNVIRENTARLEVLAVLNKEKMKLNHILHIEAKNKEKSQQRENFSFLEDIGKLKEISKSQQDQIQAIKDEIKLLKTKSLPPKPIQSEIDKLAEQEELLLGDFGSLDELYEPPQFKIEDKLLVKEIKSIEERENEKITEDEIVVCVHELMKEVADSAVVSEESQKDIVVKILSEIIDQVPLNYLKQETSLEYIARLIKKVVSDIPDSDKHEITKKVSEHTNRSEEMVSDVLNSILEVSVDAEGIEEESDYGSPYEDTDQTDPE